MDKAFYAVECAARQFPELNTFNTRKEFFKKCRYFMRNYKKQELMNKVTGVNKCQK